MIGPTLVIILGVAIAAVASLAFAEELDRGDPVRAFVLILALAAYLVALALAVSAILA